MLTLLKLQLDMLQEENDVILDKVSVPQYPTLKIVRKYLNEWLQEILVILFVMSYVMPEFALQLRRADEKREEAEARARELEKQVNNLSSQ